VIPAKLAAVLRGRSAERHVGEQLVAAGWSVRATNWRSEAGELDLVVERDGVLRFVEVKARAEGDADGLEAITLDKRRRLTRAAEDWLAQNGPPASEAAFLVALVTVGPGGFQVELWDDPF
jgi:putative endonuclease